MESEFGKGLVICLVKFAEHREKWQKQKALYEKMRQGNPRHFSESQAVEHHFNGASDHLYDIEVPANLKKTKIGKLVKQLQKYGLEMGHGFTGKEWTERDVEKAYTMCQEIALLIDKELGLEPDIGKW